MPASVPAPADQAEDAAAWERVKLRLRKEFGEDVYTSWLARLELESIDAEGTAHLSVPTRFLKSWVEAQFGDRIARIFGSELARVQRIALSLRTVGPRPPQPAPGRAAPPP
ncbi:MAG TPA: DnaA N-terminal domain-containing protein, partial [Hyphomicrobiales bacterium]|nr:DnaA N-terminal domain-containing protein [Hyphomicrobiales bacterium]